MKLSEMAQLEGVKLLDSNVLHEHTELIQILYDCTISEQIPQDLLVRELDHLRMCNSLILNNDIFSIEEVGEEQREFLNGINHSHSFHSGPKIMKYMPRSRKRPYSRWTSVANKKVEKRRKAEQNETAQDNLLYLNKIGRETTNLIRRIRKNNITSTFSQRETQIYNQFVDYFIRISEKYPLLLDQKERNTSFKTREPCDFNTDEKLTAAAFTVATKCPVIIISRDTGLIKLIAFFNTDIEEKRSFNLQDTPYPINLYSDLWSRDDFSVVQTHSRTYYQVARV